MSTQTMRRIDLVIEDVEWMLRGQESLSGAARRLGYAHGKSLERVLDRAGRPDLAAALRANEPVRLDLPQYARTR